jgi:ABC-type branched-subunit amino acid transport system ATPase component
MAAQPGVAPDANGSLLDISRLTMLFGGLRAVSDFDMRVPEGRLYGLIGPNGAGKTTVFNMITGLYEPTEGSILFDQDGSWWASTAPHHPVWRRAHLSEHPPVPEPDGAG